MNNELIKQIVKCTLLRSGYTDNEINSNLEYIDVMGEWAAEGTEQVLESIGEAGYAIVPLEPTDEIYAAGVGSALDSAQIDIDHIYKVMIKAAEGE